jgi:hypothetical protein
MGKLLSSSTSRRVANRLKREVLRIPPLRQMRDRAYHVELEQHASLLPRLTEEDALLVDAIRHEGAGAIDLESLGIPGTARLLEIGQSLIPALASYPLNSGSTVSMPLEQLIAHPEIYRFGLEERLLDIVESYIGLPPMYLGADFKRERADSRAIDVRQWHLDVEDRRMLKLILYLNDVSITGGPFEYVPKDATHLAAVALRYHSGFVSDDAMDAVVPRSNWRACTGQVGFAVLGDTCGIFHRATPPISQDRFSITFSYSSRHPVTTYETVAFTEEQMRPILDALSERQRSCVCPKTCPV